VYFNINKTTFVPLVTRGCETWSLSTREGKRVLGGWGWVVSDHKKKQEVKREWRKFTKSFAVSDLQQSLATSIQGQREIVWTRMTHGRDEKCKTRRKKTTTTTTHESAKTDVVKRKV
jgi:hypothetical protein